MILASFMDNNYNLKESIVNLFARVSAVISAVSIITANAFAAPVPVAEYTFNNSLASGTAAAPALGAVNPLGLNGYRTDTVFGVQRTVYDFIGATPSAMQAGLTLDVASLISDSNTYSVQMQFLFTERNGQYRRILDVQNRQSDTGFYVGPGNTLQVYPDGGASVFTNGEYHDVVLSNNNGAVSWYLDGGAQNIVNTNVMDISAANMLSFFLDNTSGGAEEEYSSGSVALIRVFNEALTGNQVAELLPASVIPEPASLALLAPGLLALAAARRRRRG
jgi:hypothetical protein